VLPGVKAPSTLGTFLRAFTFGHVRQLGAVAGAMLAWLAFLVKILSGHDDHRDAVTWLDVDDSMRETYGYAKQGVGYGYNKVKGLNALLGIVSTAVSAPIIVGHRLRQGTVSSARGAAKFLADAIAAARRVGAGKVIRCRLDSAFYNHSVVAAIRKAGAQFSITARMDTAVQKAVAGISEDAWVSIKYPKAIYDEEDHGEWEHGRAGARLFGVGFVLAGERLEFVGGLVGPKALPEADGREPDRHLRCLDADGAVQILDRLVDVVADQTGRQEPVELGPEFLENRPCRIGQSFRIGRWVVACAVGVSSEPGWGGPTTTPRVVSRCAGPRRWCRDHVNSAPSVGCRQR